MRPIVESSRQEVLPEREGASETGEFSTLAERPLTSTTDQESADARARKLDAGAWCLRISAHLLRRRAGTRTRCRRCPEEDRAAWRRSARRCSAVWHRSMDGRLSIPRWVLPSQRRGRSETRSGCALTSRWG